MTQDRTTLICGDRRLKLGKRTFVMGVLNITPDSLSDGGRFTHIDDALSHAFEMLEAGADVIDIGGESTRPFSQVVPPADEQSRVLPVIKELARRNIRNLSIDTRNAETARMAMQEGVSWVNDVSAFTYDGEMATVTAKADAVILMHARGTPDVMQSRRIVYENPIDEVRQFLAQRVQFAQDAGLSADRIIVDPGIGFGKELEHNLELTRGLNSFQGIAAAVLYGGSRKRFLGELTQIVDPADRDYATLGAVAIAVDRGADIVRVHDVNKVVQMLKVVDPLVRGKPI